jgi:hypothetical protein
LRKDWPLYAYAAFTALALIFRPISDLLIGKWLEAFFEGHGVPVTEIAQAVPSLLLAGLIIWLLYRYLERQFQIQLSQISLPKIEFEPEIDVDTTTFTDGHLAGEHSWLIVHNSGLTHLDKCLVKVERIHSKGGEETHCQAALMTEARMKDGHTGRFSLGPNERKRVSLTSMDAHNFDAVGRVYLNTDQGAIGLNREGKFTLEMVAIAEAGLPARRKLNVEVGIGGFVKIAWL